MSVDLESQNNHLDKVFEIIMENTPEYIQILLIGGFALEVWVAEYYEGHSELFEGQKFVRTKDFDFCLKDLKSMEACCKSWAEALQAVGYRVKKLKPTMDEHTPEAMVLDISHADTFETQIDLFFNVHGLSKRDIWKQPNKLTEKLFVLSEIMTFYSRAWNVATLPSKKNELSISQLKQSISVIHASFLTKLNLGEERKALRLVKQVVSLASNKKIDSPLLMNHQIDLLDSIPVYHANWPEKFKSQGFPKMIEGIKKSRSKYK